MAQLVVLGSAASVPDETHDNTHLAVTGADSFVLIDCAASPLMRLKRAGLDFRRMTHLVLTHFHPDHVYGVPHLLVTMWLMGRSAPLRVSGLAHCLDRVEALMEGFGWKAWPNYFPTTFHRVPEAENAPVLVNEEFRLTASPVQHLVPTLGLRLEVKRTGRVLAYSCDTEPCAAVTRLAANADLLLHEATGVAPGHSSAAQAGQTAQAAGARRLALIHYDPRAGTPAALAAEAAQHFAGPVQVAQDFDVFDI
jgi:ribonuclease Z